MQSNHPKDKRQEQQKPRLRLPFEKRKMDFGTWTYVHRAGICATVIAMLLFGIALVTWKISLGPAIDNVVYMQFDFPDQQPEDLQEPDPNQRQEVPDYSDVANLVSNDNAELNPNIRDAQGVNAADLYAEAGKLNDQMRANREAFEEGLRHEQQMIEESRRQTPGDQTQPRQSVKVQGNVTASYSFSNPVRTHELLDIPAYKCEGGGKVVVNATLDINGYVTAATVDRSQSTPDDCLQREALNSARASRFNLDTKAPAKQRGTITYVFVPQ